MEPKSRFLRLLEFFHSKKAGTPGTPEHNQALCRALVKAADADQASIWRLDRHDHFHLVCSTDLTPDRVKGITLRAGEGIIGAVALSRQAVAVTDAGIHPMHDHRIDEQVELPTHSMISAPIIFSDFLYGVINILNQRPGKLFLPEWKEWISAAGVIYGAALASAGRLLPYEHDEIKEEKENAEPREPFRGETVIVGTSRAMQDALHLCLKAAKANLHVLVCGETGTGKELAARRIHEASDRAKGPFVAVNCAALAEALLESELFGHVKGAFTGAIHDRPGKFVAASGGTIFLDEVGEMGFSSQAKLLRVLEEKKVTPVGSEKAVNCDARIVAATNQDLRQRVEQGKFRDDLYYRLCGIEITLPPLRDRVEDIPLLALHFLHKATAGRVKDSPSGRPLRLAEEAREMLLSFNWPGNVRQLEQALLAAAAICEGEEIAPANFPAWLRIAVESGPAAHAPAPASNHAVTTEPALNEREERWREERARYLKALEATKYPSTGRWNIHAAARELGMPRKTLAYRLRKLNLVR